jgi:hypothetical protein
MDHKPTPTKSKPFIFHEYSFFSLLEIVYVLYADKEMLRM